MSVTLAAMPWSVRRSVDCPAARPWAVIADETGETAGCHESRQDAVAQLDALYANVPDAQTAAPVDPRFHADLTASPDARIPAVPLYPPRRYFVPPPEMAYGDKLTVITAGADVGRVYGYVAAWGTCLLNGNERHECLPPPKSPSGYMAAMQGDTVLDDGARVATANIGGGVNHAPEGDISMAVDYYANVATQLVRARYGEDDHGVWLAGALWPDATWADVATLRAASVSGDWRWRRELAAHLGDPDAWDLAGVQLVNSPGYPLYRAVAAATPMIVAEQEALMSVPCQIHPVPQAVPPTAAPVAAAGTPRAASCACETPAHGASATDHQAAPMEPGDGDTGRLDALESSVGDLDGRVAALEDALFAAEVAKLDAQAAALRLPEPV